MIYLKTPRPLWASIGRSHVEIGTEHAVVTKNVLSLNSGMMEERLFVQPVDHPKDEHFIGICYLGF